MSFHEDAGFPLSAAQEGIWYAQRLIPANAAYNTGECVEIHGPVDAELFETALRRTVAEAETFALRLAETADGPRGTLSPTADWPLHCVDVSAEADPHAAAEAWMRADLATAVDLTEGPLFTQALFRAAPDRWFWYQRAHHILLDGYGFTLIAQRLAETYSALVAGQDVKEAFAPLSRLLDEENAYRASEHRARDRAYWTERFADAPGAVGLTEGTAPPSPACLRRSTVLTEAEAERLSAAGARLGAGRAELLLAATAAYVHRCTGATDVVLGVPVLNRRGTAALRAPGVATGVLPLRLALRPATTAGELVRSVAAELRALRGHQRYRGEDLRRDLKLLGGSRRLYGPVVNLMSFSNDPSFGGHPTTNHHLSVGPVEDLSVTVRPGRGGAGLEFFFDANPALYTEAVLAEHQERFLRLLDQLADAAQDLPVGRMTLLGAEEHVSYDQPLGAPPEPDATLPARFEAQAARTPGAVAVTYEGASLSYGELNARANRLARLLVERGAGRGRTVALALSRSTELVVGVLAVLKAGAAYLPLDPAYPAERLRAVTADAQPWILMTQADVAPGLPDLGIARVVLDDTETGQDVAAYSAADLTDAERLSPLTPGDAAYVIHTSGSTGRPKG
ncbi:condensation domain-containing protein, partial [Streptomyces sp. NPDC046215]